MLKNDVKANKPMTKVVIIGNNVAGTFTAQNIRNLNEDVEIEMYTQESYPYYSRINLPELISNKKSIEDLIVFKDEWYKKNNINLFLNHHANSIDTKSKSIQFDNPEKKIAYDKLILTLGSMPNIPPIKNAIEMKNEGKGVYTLRSIKDAFEIRDFIREKDVNNAIVIGGGLLGLELANQIKDSVQNTTVVEFFPRLLPRQLDEQCSLMLKDEIESRGINVVLDASTDEILGNGSVSGIRLKTGKEFDAEIVLIQAGIVPTISLAKEANIKTNRGIIVNEFLETSEKDVYAAGDCIEYNEQIWGIIPACMEQSKIVAASALNLKKKEYHGTMPKNTLKIVGVDLTSIGIIDPAKEESSAWNILKKADKKSYDKIVLKGNKLKGAILFGDTHAVSYVNKKMEQDVSREELLELLELYKYKCDDCGMIYDETKEELLFKNLPDDWKCPNCGNPKKNFKKEKYNDNP
jgi:nitrite reductase (NADH) large subunit